MANGVSPSLGALLDPASRADPYPILNALREAAPQVLLDGDLVVVTGYEDCGRLLRDPRMSSDRRRSRMGKRMPKGAAVRNSRTFSILSLDPPDHTRIRRLVAKAFTPRVVAELEPRIVAAVGELFDRIADQGTLDVVADLAYPLPVRIICELLGVPAADQQLFHGWSARLVRGTDPLVMMGASDELADVEAAFAEFSAYFTALIAERRARPKRDLVSDLVRIEEQGDQLSEEELLSVCVLLLIAGHETTTNLISNAVLALLRSPAELVALQADPARINAVVEETLRYDTPVQLTTRVTRAEVTVAGGQVVPEDAVLLMLLGAANRDPAAFEDPDVFRPDRYATGNAPQHLSFAAGPHFCIGAVLARLEGALVLNAFAQRVTGAQLDAESITYRPHVNLRGLETLIVPFDKITAA
jgi:cytochrome P450